ncbi:MAG: hypothetical protein P0Y66_13815 [Candidatus Kaistia colombiensis]|nr:MAG: hypothetical protein P0Y66_13815 [Kaistia sp.]
MRIVTLAALAVVMVPLPAGATMLERQTGRAIRNAGHWCDRVSHMAVDTKVSTPKRRVVVVTCDDGTRYVQYSLVLGTDNKITSIAKQ